jgi:hypothetical protein
MYVSSLAGGNDDIQFFKTAQLCPVAVPEIFFSLSARKISTAATPYCSLHPPQAALANVPASVTLRKFSVVLKLWGFYHVTSGKSRRIDFSARQG